ncbi:hypothetical protein LR48_Vigan04g082300 [Vigna angularis]|uniref:Uncharacterized protein n=1 Tax=Phaseolus angularis TaxID=3914 RepID=A0A0L9UCH7_PHAAN|nr:hypothetical protein LR48_Vigan04g082300 [Vigna angularis]
MKRTLVLSGKAWVIVKGDSDVVFAHVLDCFAMRAMCIDIMFQSITLKVNFSLRGILKIYWESYLNKVSWRMKAAKKKSKQIF